MRGRLCLTVAVFALLLTSSACGPSGSLLDSEVVVADAEFPSALAFAPDGRLFYNELKTGNIRVVTAEGRLLAGPFARVEVATNGEWGLLGLAIDPDFPQNHYVYVYYTRPIRRNVAQPVVLRFTDRDSRGVEPTPVFEDLPRTDPPNINHVAGHVHFGPDGALYISIGDFGRDPENAQDLATVKGKILRVDKGNGSPAPGNPSLPSPAADPRIFAYGLRNPFDFAFQPGSGRLYATDNGPDRCDELDLILPGHNYGWPVPYRQGSCRVRQGDQAVLNFHRSGKQPWQHGSPVAPTGLEFASGAAYPKLGDVLLACEWLTGRMWALTLDGGGSRVLEQRLVVRDCRVDVAQDARGVIYYSNSKEIRRLLPR